MDSSDLTCPDRRFVLIAAGAGAATLLAGCSTYGEQEAPGSSAVPSNPAASTGSSAASGSAASSAAGGGGAAIASLAEVPVGGGKVIADAKIVVVRPSADVVKAFSAVCTHAGCPVSQVKDGTINCPCHGSKFSVADGSVVAGPARRPLAPVQVSVSGDRIVRA